jgi:predicted kinase
VDSWIAGFEELMGNSTKFSSLVSRQDKTLIMPIGPSGCGKSSYLNKCWEFYNPIHHYSWDKLRLEWYDADYATAYTMSCDDPHFVSRCMTSFNDLVKTGQTIYVDNTNLSRKRRRVFIDAARKHGYTVIGCIFPIELDTVLKRQFTRGDKCVPGDAVRQHYMSLQCPLLGEFDSIEVVNTLD